MTIELTTEMQEIIREQLATGRYATEAEVVRSALRRLKHEEAFEQDILAAMDDEAAGRVKTLDEFITDFRQKNPVPTMR